MEQVKSSVKISDSEWEVMRVIWTLGQTTAQEITAILGDSMDWKPATVKTLLGRLVKKEVIWTEQEGKKFIYHPAITEAETVKSASEKLFSQICAKKVGATIADLIENSVLSVDDIEKIQEQLKKKTGVAEVPCNCIPGQCVCSYHK